MLLELTIKCFGVSYRRHQRTDEVCKNERDFRKNPWEYAHKNLQPSENTEPSFGSEVATSVETGSGHPGHPGQPGHIFSGSDPDWIT